MGIQPEGLLIVLKTPWGRAGSPGEVGRIRPTVTALEEAEKSLLWVQCGCLAWAH